jgi:hypothetical protein
VSPAELLNPQTVAIFAATVVVQLGDKLLERLVLMPRRLKRIAQETAVETIRAHERKCPGFQLVQPLAGDIGVGSPS